MVGTSECNYPKIFSGKITFNRSKLIKKGAFGFVFLGDYNNGNVHVKRIAIDRVQLTNNIDIQIKLKHENVVKLLTIEVDKDFWYIVIECHSGTLTEVIEGKYQGPDLPSDVFVLQQLINGLYYIQLKQLVHGDIKPDNIVISRTGQIKISSDFRICKIVLPKDTIIMDEYENTALWMAPEILIPYNEPSFDDDVYLDFTTSSDIFSSGCVFFVFATRKDGGIHPYGNRRNHLEVLYNMKKKRQVNIEKLTANNNFLTSLVERMIAHEPQERPSAKDIIQQLLDISMRMSATLSKMTQSSSSDRIQYCVGELLGKGCFSHVYVGHCNGKQVAVKVIPIENEISPHKVELQIKFRHDNVLKILDMDTEREGNYRCIALELCVATLEDFIKQKYIGLTLTHAHVMHQIAIGLTYIHSMNIDHGNIKPSNILISNSNNKQAIIKLSDFGYNRMKTNKATADEQTIESQQWMAPELLKQQLEAIDELNSSIKSDTFSAGIVYFVLVTRGIHPFGEECVRIKENILNNHLTKITELRGDHYAYALIESMLRHDPEERPEMSDVWNRLQRYI